MSSIPTSLIVVLLVAAWLIVLVPMFARRREAVPETDEESTGFRVLRRSERSALRTRRRDVPTRMDNPLDREPLHDSDPGTDAQDFDGGADQDDVGNLVDDEVREVALTPASVVREPVAVGARTRAGDRPDAADEWAAEQARRPARPTYAGDVATDRRDADRRDADRAGADRDRPFAGRYSVDRPSVDRYDGDRTERDGQDRRSAGEVRPANRRAGRGGFDPEAAEIDRRYKYRRRRRVLLTLVLIALAAGGVGYLATNLYAWAGTAAAGLLLVGYLVYLRRQVRIEDQIRQRRLARQRRARQIRPEHERSPYAQSRSPYQAPVAPVTYRDSLSDSLEPRQAAASVPPPQVRPGRVVVDLDDDDPAFDDLETHRTRTYRRQAG